MDPLISQAMGYIYIYIIKKKTKDRLIQDYKFISIPYFQFLVWTRKYCSVILLCNKLHWALYQENLNVQLLNDFLVLRELLQTLV